MDNFSDLGFDEAYKQQVITKAAGERIDILINQVFNTAAGHELLEIWAEALIMKPTAQGGMDLITIGINEGKKEFLRGIINTIKRMDSSATLPPKRKPRKKA